MNKLVYAAALPVALSGCCQEAAQPKQPNVIVFLADDLGYGDLSAYGNNIISTPALDKFASEGVVLTDCHSAGTVSSPSRAGIMTGRNPYRLSFFYIHGKKNYLNTDEVTLAELMKEGGYETGFWGKWHLSTLEKGAHQHPSPSEQGFDYWMATTLNAFGTGPKNPKKFIKNGEALGEVDGWYCDVIVDDARDWLTNQRDTEKPFFLYICSHEPHTPIAPPEEYSEAYRNAEVDALEKDIKYGGVGRPDNIGANKDEYYGTVTQLDDAFGRLMATLEELGLSENTVVLFTSDNGPEAPVTDEESLGEWTDPIRDYCFGSPGDLRGMKRFPYEGGHRVPGIVRYPNVIPAGSRSDVLFSGCDVLPTICGITGIETTSTKPLDGLNAFNAFLGKEVKERESTIWFSPAHEDTYFRMPQVTLRRGDYTLIGWLPSKPDELSLNDWVANYNPDRFELYDLSKDPEQQNDIVAQHPELVTSMKSEMISLWREMCDEGFETMKRN